MIFEYFLRFIKSPSAHCILVIFYDLDVQRHFRHWPCISGILFLILPFYVILLQKNNHLYIVYISLKNSVIKYIFFEKYDLFPEMEFLAESDIDFYLTWHS